MAPHLVGILASVPELHVHPVLLRLKRQRRAQEEDRIHTTLVAGNCTRRS